MLRLGGARPLEELTDRPNSGNRGVICENTWRVLDHRQQRDLDADAYGLG